MKKETLWALAGRYLGNPFRWPLIYEANRSQIENPDLIYPGQLFAIPVIGAEVAQVQGVEVVTGDAVSVAGEEAPTAAEVNWIEAGVTGTVACSGSGERTIFYAGSERKCAPPPGSWRTAFYSRPLMAGGGTEAYDGLPGSGGSAGRGAVPYGLVYSAGWLDAPGVHHGSLGTLEGILENPYDATGMVPARIGGRVVIEVANEEDLRVGDLLQTFRTVREDRKLGTAQRPTGVLVVIGGSEDGVVAMVSTEYDRIWIGDMIKRAPDYRPRTGALLEPVESDVVATVLGFPEERPVYGYGASVFLDLGMEEGIAIGDVFQATVGQPGPLLGVEALRLQVVLAEDNRSTARIVGVTHPGLETGDRIRLIAKIQ